MHQLKKLLLFFLFVTLSGCAFHPRGAVPLSPPLQHTYLKTSDPYGQLAQNLRQAFKLSGAKLAKSSGEATVFLAIISEEKNQQLLSVSGTQQTRQYNLGLSVTFQFTNPAGQPLIAPEKITETRTITTQSNQILGDSNEANYLYQKMYRAMTYDIMNRLSSKDISTVLITHR